VPTDHFPWETRPGTGGATSLQMAEWCTGDEEKGEESVSVAE
jgi:hypothetical protein